MRTIDPTNVLSAEELAPLLERKRKVQAELAVNQHSSQTQSQGGCSSGGCGGGGQSRCSSSRAAPPSATSQQPQVLKALLIAISILAVAALAWWGVSR
ncbi:hypothetical protein [Simplicispira psychrophila]|uniref:hypothetical protein n=1 Tax=Simplicispira psychrophila TaxID=80882 RepID=UPI0012EC3A04|nr:hypothetical protein [Simplicispira psychrophila]